MSNTAVGNVYQQIIEEVINSSRADFEDGGVDESVLEELRKGWQLKLTQLEVASFPWDPKPDPVNSQAAAHPPASSAPAPAPAAAPYSQAQLSPHQPHPQALPNMAGMVNDQFPSPGLKQEPLIKQEPGTDNPQMMGQYGPASSQHQKDLAAQRAQQHLDRLYGQKATNSIQAIQATTQSTGAQPSYPPQHAQNLQQQQQYQRSMAAATAAQQQRAQQQHVQPSIKTAQTDGPGDEYDDFEGVLMQHDAAGNTHELGRVDIDRIIHAKIAARAKSMEGGGLMLPLKEATKHRAEPSSRSKGKERGIAQHDGFDDDDEVADEDAINSDLDDPDDDQDDDEVDDEGLGHIMLCMYDKVQRVKNKWKCVLKDGVLTVNGKEYVFHKATGEYEW